MQGFGERFMTPRVVVVSIAAAVRWNEMAHIANPGTDPISPKPSVISLSNRRFHFELYSWQLLSRKVNEFRLSNDNIPIDYVTSCKKFNVRFVFFWRVVHFLNFLQNIPAFTLYFLFRCFYTGLSVYPVLKRNKSINYYK